MTPRLYRSSGWQRSTRTCSAYRGSAPRKTGNTSSAAAMRDPFDNPICFADGTTLFIGGRFVP